MKPKAILLSSPAEHTAKLLDRVYAPAQRARLEALVDLHPQVIHLADLARPEVAAACREAELVFSTWGMPKVTEEQLAASFPKLRATFYAAGTVQGFARPLLKKGITVVSAWAANAVPVSEFTLAQILLATKYALRNARNLHKAGPERWRAEPQGPGNYRTTVSLISLGMIGRLVAGHLKHFDLDVIAYEPFAKPGVAEELGVKLVSLDECFSQADVVSLHAPNLPQTQKMIKRQHFELMRPSATFINTARGGPVDQDAMLDVLQSRPDLTAVIDVTDPTEPPPAGSRYYSLPNLFLTPHIAGSQGREVARMADYVLDEAERFLRNEPLKYAVSEAMLETMA